MKSCTAKFAKTRIAAIWAIAGAIVIGAPLLAHAQAVTSFTLVNADTGADITTINGTGTGTVVLSNTPRINVRANATGVRSVVFTDGGSPYTENTAPYAYKGNVGPVYNKWSPAAGTYVITAKPFTGSQGSGVAGTAATLTLKVIGSPQTERFTFEKTQGPNKNPLKGWNTSWDFTTPESSVGFQYVPWKDFEPTNNTFDAQAVEKIIAKDGSKGRHLILRFYCQWEGGESTVDQLACPSWLFTQQNVRLLRGTDYEGNRAKTLVDFNDPNFLREATELIGALAATYENDPRIFAIEFGIMGYWGEWHTWNFKMAGGGGEISPQSSQQIANAFKAKFVNKRLMARYPWAEPFSSLGGIGFHNDYFRANNGHSAQFDTAVINAAKWKEGPIGGEVPPDAQPPELYLSGPTALNLITAGHYSTMAPGSYHRKPGNANYEDYMRMHRGMGYNFQINEALFSTSIARGSRFPVVVKGSNVGVAPFYYDWDVEFALLNTANAPVASAKVPTKLSSIMPAGAFHFETSLLANATLTEGTYRLAVRIVQPGASANKPQSWKLDASNVHVQFANRMDVVQPAWNAQNALVGGWSILRNVTLTR